MNDVSAPFIENLSQVDYDGDPESWNMYKGLVMLCEQLQRIEAQQQDLGQQLQALVQTRSPQ